MISRLTSFVLVLLIATPGLAQQTKKRQVNPIAESLPVLTEPQVKKIRNVIDRFIRADIGQIKGAEAKRAAIEFNALGLESIPFLMEGFNRAANIKDSCPVVAIGQKLKRLILRTQDPDVLNFIRDSAGGGVVIPRYKGYIQDVRTYCLYRLAYLRQNGILDRRERVREANEVKGLRNKLKQQTTEELFAVTKKLSGVKLKAALLELADRKNTKVVSAFGHAMDRETNQETKRLAEKLLLTALRNQSSDDLRKHLQSEVAGVRAGAAFVSGKKKYPHGSELIELLTDNDRRVRRNARAALQQLSGEDFGPRNGSTRTQVNASIERWRTWWEENADKVEG
ncbi:MAG: hypothetical protein ACFCD0_11380 [Gemmataceae bacterium]